MNPQPGDAQARDTADAVARRSYGKLVAFLAARTRDVAAAEDALSDAFAAALAGWPLHGCPDNPEAWLLTVARRKIVDAGRRARTGGAAVQQWQILDGGLAAAAAEAEIPDRRLALLFACAHPAIDPAVRAPLMLQTVVGLDAARIAAAFLVAPAAMGKRLVRAKNKIREAGIPFRIPGRDELSSRVASVLDAVYAAFTMGWSETGWSETGWSDTAAADLAPEAIFLARLCAELLPAEPEALGLLALLLHSDARRRARRTQDGEYVPLDEQNLDLWDWPSIAEAESLLLRAAALGAPGRYQLEAALQSAHVARRRTGLPNWPEVVQLYDALFALTASPVVAINRALAIAEIHGAGPALAVLPDAAADPRLAGYQPYWAARADLLARTGANAEARNAYRLAIALERDPAVRRFLHRRQSALDA